jgi:hypothetical protein
MSSAGVNLAFDLKTTSAFSCVVFSSIFLRFFWEEIFSIFQFLLINDKNVEKLKTNVNKSIINGINFFLVPIHFFLLSGDNESHQSP